MRLRDARRRLVPPASWALAVAAVLVLWAPVVPIPVRGRLDALTPFAQLVAVRPPFAVLAVVAGLVAAALIAVRRRGRRSDPGPSGDRRALAAALAPAAVVLIAGAAAAAEIAPRAFGDPAPPRPGAPVVTILAANTLLSSVDPAVIVELVEESGADVLALPETDVARASSYAAALVRSGEGRWRLFDDAIREPDMRTPGPTTLLARATLRPRLARRPPVPDDVHAEVPVRLTRVLDARGRPTGGPGPLVVAVHPVPPVPGRVADWREDVRGLRSLCREGALLAGDFNATLDHSPMRDLLDAGCDDAAAAAGEGLTPTWVGGPLGIVRPAIDHVLTSGAWRTVDAGVLPLPESDHEAVWARVTRDVG